MIRAFLALSLLVLGFLPTTGAHCAPPCGPVVAELQIPIQGPYKGIAFGASEDIIVQGQITFRVDVDRDGFFYDPENPPKVTVQATKRPPWIEATVEPSTFTVPVDDEQYLRFQGDQPGTDMEYYWAANLTITLHKLRDPAPETELQPDAGFIRRDGMYRVRLTATSTSSMLAPDALGPSYGLQSSYGIREFRIVPEVDGVRWLPDANGTLLPEDGPLPDASELGPERNIPSLLGPLVLAVPLVVLALLRRRG